LIAIQQPTQNNTGAQHDKDQECDGHLNIPGRKVNRNIVGVLRYKDEHQEREDKTDAEFDFHSFTLRQLKGT
jgi:hypothetical protein